jgi:hypothetical protein
MSITPRFINDLERHLVKECALYERYLKALDQQQDALTNFNTELMDAINAKRLRIVKDMKELGNKRLELLSDLPRGRDRRLTDLITDHIPGKNGAKLMKLALELREFVVTSQKLSAEFGMTNQFALNMVNGSLSLISHGTQNVTKRYGVQGAIKESYNPSRSRYDTVLREA